MLYFLRTRLNVAYIASVPKFAKSGRTIICCSEFPFFFAFLIAQRTISHNHKYRLKRNFHPLFLEMKPKIYQ